MFGSLRKPVIGLYVYVLFAVLRPQYLWAFAGDMSIQPAGRRGDAGRLGPARIWRKALGRGAADRRAELVFLSGSLSAVLAVNSDVALIWVVEL